MLRETDIREHASGMIGKFISRLICGDSVVLVVVIASYGSHAYDHTHMPHSVCRIP